MLIFIYIVINNYYFLILVNKCKVIATEWHVNLILLHMWFIYSNYLWELRKEILIEMNSWGKFLNFFELDSNNNIVLVVRSTGKATS